jgi:hypothetical protein
MTPKCVIFEFDELENSTNSGPKVKTTFWYEPTWAEFVTCGNDDGGGDGEPEGKVGTLAQISHQIEDSHERKVLNYGDGVEDGGAIPRSGVHVKISFTLSLMHR